MAATTSASPQKTSNYANVAANLANTNRIVVEPQPPRHEKYIPHFHGTGQSKSVNSPQSRPQSSPISLASSKAALLAHQGHAAALTKSGPSKSNLALENKAAAAAARGSNLPHTARPRRPASSDGPNSIQSNHGLGDRAAAAATKSWNTTDSVPARANTVYGTRSERANPAVSKAWREQKIAQHRPLVAPLSDREAAIIQRRIEARQQESSVPRERQPVIRIKPEYLGEHPPVRLEREEKAHAADLHEQAVNLAKQAYARQQQQAQQNASASAKGTQQHVNDRARRHSRPEIDELDAMRSYYGTPAPVQRSKSQRLLKRSKSQQSRHSDADDLAQSQRIRAQMNHLKSQIDHIDAGKQEQDRKRLLEAARKKVHNDLLKLDESVYKDTGKMSKAMMDDWDTKARERAKGARQQAAFQGLSPDRAVNIGGNRLIDRSEIDQLAISRVKPTLAGIDEAVQKKRDLDEQKREEKEEKQREKEKGKEERAEQKREKAEARRKVKEERAAQKAEAAEGGEEHHTLAEKLPSLPHFSRHKRNESGQDPSDVDHVDHVNRITDDEMAEHSATHDKKKSPLKLPTFAKFSRHRRNESADTVSDDDLSDTDVRHQESKSPRKLPLFGKLGRSHPDKSINQQDPGEEQTSPTSQDGASKSLKSRFSKLVHRHQSSDHNSAGKGRSFEHANGSVSTMTHDPENASITDDEGLRPVISAPIPIEGATPSEQRDSTEDRDDKLFGKHLPSKFHENM